MIKTQQVFNLIIVDENGNEVTCLLTGQSALNAVLDVSKKALRISLLSLRKQAVSSDSGAVEIDLNQGGVIELELTENVTSFSVSNWSNANGYNEMLLMLTQDSEARTVSFDNVDVWHTSDGGPPDISAVDTQYALVFWSLDGGTTVHGVCSRQ